ncbi:MAG: FAD-dependent oxidoreductase [Kiloniellales bacterium]|nr:FAD-dependent oxidoreductase [Kiloniellales bacterium]
MTYVVVGAGPAGVVAAETLRKAAPTAEVVLIGDEPEPPYSRMAIPYFLTGMIGEGGTYLRKTDGHYEEAKIRYLQGRVAKVTPSSKTLMLEDGTGQAYDKLLIATGASPIKPPIEGLDLPGVHHCWTLEDARNIVQLAANGSNVVLIGAGFIGCIILESLVERGVKLTVVEAEDRMVPRMADQTTGGLIKKWCESKGITVKTSTKVTSVGNGGQDGLTVTFDNGESAPASLVVVAAGVRSNTAFLADSGIQVEDGIIVDQHLQSSVPDIYAAGDCAQSRDFSTNGWAVHAIQPTAVDHGRLAALNMAGKEAEFNGSLTMNVLDTAGLISASFGAWDGVEGGESAQSLDEERFRYMRLEFDGDVLVGALSLGRTDHIGVLRGLIQTRVHLGAWKDKLKRDPHLITEAYVACTQ